MAGVVLEQVSRVYPGGVTAVCEIDLEVRDQEFLVLVGPSGSGKSTTLRMIAGLEPVTTGRIRIDGRVVNDLAPQLRNVAMVFQGQALYPHLSVYGNLAFGLELRGRVGRWRKAWRRLVGRSECGWRESGRDVIDERVRRAARRLGIEPLLGRMPSELSGGERQRVALGRAMVREPAAFLFDEPLSSLDAQLRVEMRRELKKLSRELRATVIYVTHDQVEALALGDRIVVLDRGKVQQVGTPDEVYGQPANCFVAGFIGTPPMNLVEGKIVGKTPAGERLAEEAGLQFSASGWSATVAAEHRDAVAQVGASAVVLGIRPEHVRLAASAGDSVVRGGAAGDGAAPPNADRLLPARVTALELMGDVKVVELDLASCGKGMGDGEAADKVKAGGGSIWCKVEADCKLGLGDRVNVWFEMRRAHWFNARTGENLCGSRGVRG